MEDIQSLSLAELYNRYRYYYQAFVEKINSHYGFEYDDFKLAKDNLNEAGYPYLTFREVFTLLKVHQDRDRKLNLLRRLLDLDLIGKYNLYYFESIIKHGYITTNILCDEATVTGEDEVIVEFSGELYLPGKIVKTVEGYTLPGSIRGFEEKKQFYEVKVFSRDLSFSS